MRNIWLLIVSVTLILFALVGFYLLYNSINMEKNEVKYSSVGERIYYMGKGSDGKYIEYTDGPNWLAPMKTRGCVNCHGEDGKGGYPIAMTSTVAPDITYNSLTSAEPYTDETIKRAITQGIDESGEQLNIIMPRWKMTAEDLDEILAYLKDMHSSQK